MNASRRIILLTALLACATAAAYPIQVSLETHGLDVLANASLAGNGTILDLVSSEPTSVRCDVNFRNGPERRLRRVTVEPAGRRTVTFNPRRQVTRLRITVECWPAHQDDDPEIDEDIEQIIED